MTVRTARRISRRVILVTACLLVMGLVASSPSSASGGGTVLPASARPRGYSLLDMTRALASFTTSGNNVAYLPDTPFQVLYAQDFRFEPRNSGLVVTGTGSFRVDRHTPFFVPVHNATDSPPVYGDFPARAAGAAAYFGDEDQLGGDGFAIVVDGHRTRLGLEYVAGPVTAKLFDDVASPEGRRGRIITLGVFLRPLSPGRHTVVILGHLDGKALAAHPDPDAALAFLRFQFTYTVDVSDR